MMRNHIADLQAARTALVDILYQRSFNLSIPLAPVRERRHASDQRKAEHTERLGWISPEDALHVAGEGNPHELEIALKAGRVRCRFQHKTRWWVWKGAGTSMQNVRTIGGYGPFSPGLSDVAERNAQLRSMGAVAYMMLGPHHPLPAELRAAEVDAVALERAQELVEALPALMRRKLLATHAAITWPRPPRRAPR
jgi:hypothetical protein